MLGTMTRAYTRLARFILPTAPEAQVADRGRHHSSSRSLSASPPRPDRVTASSHGCASRIVVFLQLRRYCCIVAYTTQWHE